MCADLPHTILRVQRGIHSSLSALFQLQQTGEKWRENTDGQPRSEELEAECKNWSGSVELWQVLVSLFHCLLLGIEGAREGAECRDGVTRTGGRLYTQAARERLRVGALFLLSSLFENGAGWLSCAHGKWLGSVCAQVYSFGWVDQDSSVQVATLRALVGALECSEATVAARHATLLAKVVKQGALSSHTHVRHAAFDAVHRILLASPVSDASVSGNVGGGVGACGSAAAVMTSAVRPVLGAVAAEVASGLLLPACVIDLLRPGGGADDDASVEWQEEAVAPVHAQSLVAPAWAVAEALLLWGALATAETTALASAVIRAAPAVLSSGGMTAGGGGIMVSQILGRLVVARVLDAAHLQMLDELTRTGSNAPRAPARASDIAQFLGLMSLKVTRIYMSAGWVAVTSVAGPAMAAQQAASSVLAIVRVCGEELLSALQDAFVGILTCMMPRPYAVSDDSCTSICFYSCLVSPACTGLLENHDLCQCDVRLAVVITLIQVSPI